MQRHTYILLFCIVMVVLSIGIIDYARKSPAQLAPLILYALSLSQLLLAGGFYIWAYRRGLTLPNQALKLSWTTHIKRYAAATLILGLVLFTISLFQKNGTLIIPDLHQLIWLIVYQLFLIGLTEEILFRGLPFAAFPWRPISAVLISSVLFSLYHWNNGLITLPYYFALGIVFAIFRYFSFSLIALAIGHCIFNLTFQLFPAIGFVFSPSVFYTVIPFALISLAMLGGWLLSSIEKSHSSP